MSLPLLTRLHESRMPFVPAPGAGEQYRFHFDMSRCIGCKCCVVACNEQNGNPASINWRRVAEIEAGWFPTTKRFHLSMGCNQCVSPTCLSGCPVDAYTKDAATGIVRHSADACIGCQYCTWTCSYGVPQYDSARGVVGKCDMCYGRLEQGQTPACVSACPEGAIAIEIVPVETWRAAATAAAPASGLPVSDGSLSTTRLTLPPALPAEGRAVDATAALPQDAHWSLVLMTVLTQLAVGAFLTIWVLQMLGAADLGTADLGGSALVAFIAAGLGLASATAHLGRPAHAYRAMKGWRHSWLSREVVLLTTFAIAGGVYAAALSLEVAGSALLGALTCVLGAAGVTASACIYRLASRPAWNTPWTLVQFNLTAGATGPLLIAAATAGAGWWAAPLAAGMAGLQLTVIAIRFMRLVAGRTMEHQATARLLSTTLRSRFIARTALLAGGGVVLPLVAESSLVLWTSLGIAFVAEVLGRYLFFVSAVPRHMAASYVELGGEAI